jgi:hypothetical protein
MVTSIEQAKHEQPVSGDALALEHSLAAAAARLPEAMPSPTVATTQTALPTAANHRSGLRTGGDAMDFVADNRIHVKDGSLFIDPYLVIHPRELKPENETRLREKLRLTYSVNNPSFYESSDRLAIALNLAQLVPVSLKAKHSRLMDEVKKFNAQVDSGVDADLLKLQNDKQHPFAAIVRDTLEKPTRDPVGIETLQNGVSIYLLLREKLTKQGYLGPLASYVGGRAQTPDQVLGELAPKIGISPIQMREAALRGGLEGIGTLLGLDPAYVADVKKFSAHAATQDFSLNLIDQWHLGRQLLGIQAPLAQKIETGIAARVEKTIADARAQLRNRFEVPEPVKAEEKRVAEALNLVDPIQRALMFKLGYEICFTPDVTADSIAKYNGIYGLHRKAANDLRDVRGTYRIYFSGRGDLKGSMRTLVHEVAHNLWPEQFSGNEVKAIDALAASDAKHFAKWQGVVGEPDHFVTFEKFFNAYKAGNDQEKAAVIASTNAWLAPQGITVDGLFPYLREARDFQFMVQHAYDTLSVEGARYAKSGYDSPNERFREVISRFAELKQVEYKSEPQLLHFLAPGLDQIWEAHYIPHLNRVYQGLLASDKGSVGGHSLARDESALPHAAYEGAMGTLESPKVVERPVEATQPKVEQRPTEPAVPAPHGTPVKAASAEACLADGMTPQNTIDAPSASLNGLMSERGLAALNTLNAMGISAR